VVYENVVLSTGIGGCQCERDGFSAKVEEKRVTQASYLCRHALRAQRQMCKFTARIGSSLVDHT
jgi:hypothetical protein